MKPLRGTKTITSLRPPAVHLLVLLAVVLMTTACANRTVADQAEARPNFIIVYTDDQQYRGMGANENDIIITPALDQLAAEGMRFTNARIVLPLCSPSRAALLTGRYGSANGVNALARGLNEGEVTFAQQLQAAGYRTGLTGKWHLGPKPTHPDFTPKALGFDVSHYCWSNGPYYKRKIFHGDGTTSSTGEQHIDEYGTDRAIDFLREAVNDHPGKPFVLYHNTQTPHMDGNLIWDAREDTMARYDADAIPLPESWDDDLAGKPEYLLKVRGRTKAQKDYGYTDPAKIKAHTRDYYAVITELDSALQRLFAEVEALGLRENTYIIMMGDNGWLMGDHGMTSKVFPYDASSRVPCFVVGPGVKPGTTSDAQVLNIDVMPTLLSLAGVAPVTDIHGEDLSGLIHSKADSVRDFAVLEILGGYGGNKPILAAFDGRYELVLTYETASDTEPSFVELYDLRDDPWELTNLADSQAVQDQRAALEAAIMNHRRTVLKEGQ